MKTFGKIFLALIIALLLAGVTAMAAVGDYIYDYVLSRYTLGEALLKDGLDTPEKEAKYKFYIQKKEEYTHWMNQENPEDLFIKSKDELTLHSTYLKGQSDTNCTVIIAHGYRSDGTEMVPYARYFQDTYGFNVLLPDARGHGQSEGNYVGMGWPDRLDLLLWIQEVIHKNGPDTQIILYGASMGGATVMMASGEKLPSQVKFIVEDCGFTSAYDIIEYQMSQQMNGSSSTGLMESLTLVAQAKAGYSLKEASAIEQVKKAKIPLLFIHGEKDTFVPPKMLYELFEAAKAPKQMVLAKNANHMEALSDSAAREALDQYIQKYLQ